MLKTKKKKTILVILSLLAITIIAFVLVCKCLNTDKVYYSDDDNGFIMGEYLCYNNVTVTANNKDFEYADIYNLSENTSIRTDLSVPKDNSVYFKRLYGNKVVYTKDYSLYVYDIENNTNERICEDFYGIAPGKNSFAYYDFDNTLWLYDVVNNSTEIIEEYAHQRLHGMTTENDYLYILREKDYYYYITVFNLMNKEKEADIAINNGIEDYDDYVADELAIIPNDDKVYFIKNGIFENIYQYDFSGKKEEKRFFEEMPSYFNMFTVNGDFVYYTISHGKENVFNKVIWDNEENGLYRKNINTGEITKLSDKCDFDEIIPTENYVYCYKVNYLIPQSIIKIEEFDTGYELEQIPVNGGV